MSDSNKNPSKKVCEVDSPEAADTAAVDVSSPNGGDANRDSPQRSIEEQNVSDRQKRNSARRWWIAVCVQPMLFLAAGVIFIVGLGIAQRLGFVSAGGKSESSQVSGEADVMYICPMMCTPPQSEPGRCPICAMELQPTTTTGGKSGSRSIQIDPVARRIANIQTVAVQSTPRTRKLRTVGELQYDEGNLKTISAYFDGRLDRLYADYTGYVVQKGDPLALVYSPRLYSTQAELLSEKKKRDANRRAPPNSIPRNGIRSNRDFYESTRQRLIELGMTETQIEQLENTGDFRSRIHLNAPISGTVIEKLASEGEYVKEGQPIYKLADLSTVWLMLKLFPEDAATIRYGEKVEAIVQSLPGKKFTGRVAFRDPNVDPKTRTVGVRVVIPNTDGLLRIGDYAKATIEIPLSVSPGHQGKIYDTEFADKWISPRHPHVVESSPGQCSICGADLVPASEFGYSSKPTDTKHALIVPRNAVLMAANESVLYVETEPGRFEIRRVVLGPTTGNHIVIQAGVQEGELVATRGNFLIDSQMQVAQNPSLIDPTKGDTQPNQAMTKEMIAALSKLSEADRVLAEQQRICPVAGWQLGQMGTPIKVDVEGTSVFICCEKCREDLFDNPAKYLAKITDDEKSDDVEIDTSDLPPIRDPELIEPQSEPPSIENPQTSRNVSPGHDPQRNAAFPTHIERLVEAVR